MSYVRPGVEVTQAQRTFSPTLIQPDLQAVVIGPAYKVVNLGDHTYDEKYIGESLPVEIQGLGDGLELDPDSVYIRLSRGTRFITGWVNDPDPIFTLVGNEITINADLEDGEEDEFGPFAEPEGSGGVPAAREARIEIGYRALKTEISDFMTLESVNEIQDRVGEITSLNPLGLGAYIALLNANTAVNVATLKTSNVNDSAAHASARDVMETREVYAMAPLTGLGSILLDYDAYAVAMSHPLQKRERINLGTPWVSFVDADGVPATDISQISRPQTALQLKQTAEDIGQKRAFRLFPDYGYLREVRHVATLSPDFMENIFGSHLGTLKARLTSRITLDGEIFYSGTEITEEIYELMKASGTQMFDVLVPIPGYFFSAVVAGQVAGLDPEQGHTNMPTVGVEQVRFSSDFFTESQLNTIASGGNYILWQTSPTAPISSRHQLSTDMSSIETRELNITKSVDFVAKFIRNTLSPLIGRHTITPRFMELLAFTLNALGANLKRTGRINDFVLESLVQDAEQPDTVLVSFRILPRYPVNYIKVDLIF